MRQFSYDQAAAFVEIVSACLHREFPNHIVHLLHSPEDVGSPRELTPAFFGCFDWHSAVHSHWTLIRVARCFPETDLARRALRHVAESLTRDRLAGEVRYLSAAGREGFERPYGLAWLLQLAMECREWGTPQTRSWCQHLSPLEELARCRLASWLSRLTHPIRSGEHGQSAFAMGLAWDWSQSAGDDEFGNVIAERARYFYGRDVDYRLAYEPSGHDFLSPALAEADLMRRIEPADAFAGWLDQFLPGFGRDGGLAFEPVSASDPADGKLAHLDGLNLSRAWMLEGIATALPAGDLRTPALKKLAGRHAERGVQAVTGEYYAGAHWLPTFAVYLLTGRGLSQ